ncbi:DUF3040 domain-containing protein [Streptomyces sp. NRRL S-646]|uniref:DUF3040 domain-containing protein n=1 Tax=Streptomyces sp. NRRL S-646 TaxID=1463917 RepID=UPI0004CC407D|nr:DUF3040 domain-containing protein [Streptomyces sp. NRRL S-646]
MAEHPDPENVVLSSHERLALRSIEAQLSCERRLARGMRRRPRSQLWLPPSVALLTCSSLFLVVMGVRTADPVVIWCFAGLWPFTVVQSFRLLCRAGRGGARITSWL